MGKRMTIKELKEVINFMKDDAIIELIDEEAELDDELENEKIANCKSLLNNTVTDYRKILVKLSNTLADGLSISADRKHQILTYGHRINRLISECILEAETTKHVSHIKGLVHDIKINHDMVNGVIDYYRDYADDDRKKLIDGVEILMNEILELIETNLI